MSELSGGESGTLGDNRLSVRGVEESDWLGVRNQSVHQGEET